MSTRPQSTFVTVGWVFTILSGLGTLVAALQSVMVATMFYGENSPMAQAAHAPNDPIGDVIFKFFPFFVFAFFALSAMMLAGSIGLLRRRNWGRLIVIGLLAFAIVYQLGGIAVQQWMISSMQETMPPEAFADGPGAQMQTMMQVFRIVMIVFSLALAGLFAWIIKRLVSPAIKAEFLPG